MGRSKLDIPIDALLDMSQKGLTTRDMAGIVNCSRGAIERRIKELQRDQGIIAQYRKVQNLHLTQIQHEVLEAITPEKIQYAELGDLVRAFDVLKKAELTDQGKPSEIKGFVHYLMKLEEEEVAIATPVDSESESTIGGENEEYS